MDRFIPRRNEKSIEFSKYRVQERTVNPSILSHACFGESVLEKNILQIAKRTTKTFSFDPYFHKVIAPPKEFMLLDVPDFPAGYFRSLVDWGTDDLVSIYCGTNRSGIYTIPPVSPREGGANFIATYEKNRPPTSLRMSSANGRIAVATMEGAIDLLDIEKKEIISTTKFSSEPIYAMDWAPMDNKILSIGRGDGAVCFFDSRDPNNVTSIEASLPSSNICGIKWSPCQRYTAVGWTDGTLEVNDRRTVKNLASFDLGGAVKAMDWAPGESLSITAGTSYGNNKITTYNVNSGEKKWEIDAGASVPFLSWISPRYLAYTSGDQQSHVTIHDSVNERQTVHGKTYDGCITSAAVSPCKRKIATISPAEESLSFSHIDGAPTKRPKLERREEKTLR